MSPKLFWSHIKAKRGGSSVYPASLSDGLTTVSNNIEICDMFASYFSTVYTVDTVDTDFDEEYNSLSPSLKFLSNNSQCLTAPVIDKDTIFKKLKNIDCSKGHGPDGIPPIFISSCASELVEPLWLIYNKSLATGIFPEDWKTAKVVPIHKSDSDTLVSHYRPISIQSCFPKILESIVCPHIQRHVQLYLTDHQHGFVSSRSTCTNLVTFTELLSNSIDAGQQTDVIYTDFSKAFDRVSHTMLVRKLSMYGLVGSMLEWLRSYLTGRHFYVVVNGYQSTLHSITSGVPQGSHLAPILFNVFVNDIPECFHHAKVFMYADDLKFAQTVSSPEDIALLQGDIDRLSVWCQSNRMQLNTKKCVHIKFTRKHNTIQSQYYIDGHKLEEVEVIRDLGVLLDRKLTFIPHIDNIIKKASKMLGFIIRSGRSFRRSKTKILLYYSLVRSVMEYCSVVWRPHYAAHSLRLERIQKRFVRHLAFRDPVVSKKSVSYKRRLQHFKIQSLETRRTILDALFLHKLVQHKIDCPQLLELLRFRAPFRFPRNHITPLCPPLRRSVSGRNSPICRLTSIANSCSDVTDIHYDSPFALIRTILTLT